MLPYIFYISLTFQRDWPKYIWESQHHKQVVSDCLVFRRTMWLNVGPQCYLNWWSHYYLCAKEEILLNYWKILSIYIQFMNLNLLVWSKLINLIIIFCESFKLFIIPKKEYLFPQIQPNHRKILRKDRKLNCSTKIFHWQGEISSGENWRHFIPLNFHYFPLRAYR